MTYANMIKRSIAMLIIFSLALVPAPTSLAQENTFDPSLSEHTPVTDATVESSDPSYSDESPQPDPDNYSEWEENESPLSAPTDEQQAANGEPESEVLDLGRQNDVPEYLYQDAVKILGQGVAYITITESIVNCAQDGPGCGLVSRVYSFYDGNDFKFGEMHESPNLEATTGELTQVWYDFQGNPVIEDNNVVLDEVIIEEDNNPEPPPSSDFNTDERNIVLSDGNFFDYDSSTKIGIRTDYGGNSVQYNNVLFFPVETTVCTGDECSTYSATPPWYIMGATQVASFDRQQDFGDYTESSRVLIYADCHILNDNWTATETWDGDVVFVQARDNDTGRLMQTVRVRMSPPEPSGFLFSIHYGREIVDYVYDDSLQPGDLHYSDYIERHERKYSSDYVSLSAEGHTYVNFEGPSKTERSAGFIFFGAPIYYAALVQTSGNTVTQYAAQSLSRDFRLEVNATTSVAEFAALADQVMTSTYLPSGQIDSKVTDSALERTEIDYVYDLSGSTPLLTEERIFYTDKVDADQNSQTYNYYSPTGRIDSQTVINVYYRTDTILVYDPSCQTCVVRRLFAYTDIIDFYNDYRTETEYDLQGNITSFKKYDWEGNCIQGCSVSSESQIPEPPAMESTDDEGSGIDEALDEPFVNDSPESITDEVEETITEDSSVTGDENQSPGESESLDEQNTTTGGEEISPTVEDATDYGEEIDEMVMEETPAEMLFGTLAPPTIDDETELRSFVASGPTVDELRDGQNRLIRRITINSDFSRKLERFVYDDVTHPLDFTEKRELRINSPSAGETVTYKMAFYQIINYQGDKTEIGVSFSMLTGTQSFSTSYRHTTAAGLIEYSAQSLNRDFSLEVDRDTTLEQMAEITDLKIVKTTGDPFLKEYFKQEDGSWLAQPTRLLRPSPLAFYLVVGNADATPGTGDDIFMPRQSQTVQAGSTPYTATWRPSQQITLPSGAMVLRVGINFQGNGQNIFVEYPKNTTVSLGGQTYDIAVTTAGQISLTQSTVVPVAEIKQFTMNNLITAFGFTQVELDALLLSGELQIAVNGSAKTVSVTFAQSVLFKHWKQPLLDEPELTGLPAQLTYKFDGISSAILPTFVSIVFVSGSPKLTYAATPNAFYQMEYSEGLNIWKPAKTAGGTDFQANAQGELIVLDDGSLIDVTTGLPLPRPTGSRFYRFSVAPGNQSSTYFLTSGTFQVGSSFFNLNFLSGPVPGDNKIHSVEIYDAGTLTCGQIPCGQKTKDITYTYTGEKVSQINTTLIGKGSSVTTVNYFSQTSVIENRNTVYTDNSIPAKNSTTVANYLSSGDLSDKTTNSALERTEIAYIYDFSGSAPVLMQEQIIYTDQVEPDQNSTTDNYYLPNGRIGSQTVGGNPYYATDTIFVYYPTCESCVARKDFKYFDLIDFYNDYRIVTEYDVLGNITSVKKYDWEGNCILGCGDGFAAASEVDEILNDASAGYSDEAATNEEPVLEENTVLMDESQGFVNEPVLEVIDLGRQQDISQDLQDAIGRIFGQGASYVTITETIINCDQDGPGCGLVSRVYSFFDGENNKFAEMHEVPNFEDGSLPMIQTWFDARGIEVIEQPAMEDVVDGALVSEPTVEEITASEEPEDHDTLENALDEAQENISDSVSGSSDTIVNEQGDMYEESIFQEPTSQISPTAKSTGLEGVVAAPSDETQRKKRKNLWGFWV